MALIPAPKDWYFSHSFAPLSPGPFGEQIRALGSIADQSGIERHPFFLYAANHRKALEAWAAQEAVTTNPFSQLLLICCAHIQNVHGRAAFMPVIAGEHHKLNQGKADRSHPWLLKALCESLGIATEKIKPAQCTINFLAMLAKSVADPWFGLAALGVGNERMLIPEYTAVKKAFVSMAPDATYADFLDANITEDVSHNAILQEIAASLISTEMEFSRYHQGAIEGVRARLTYYDELLDMIRLDE